VTCSAGATSAAGATSSPDATSPAGATSSAGAGEPGTIPSLASSAAASALGGSIRSTAFAASSGPALRYPTSPAGGITMPSVVAPDSIRSGEESRAIEASSSAFWRSSVVVVSTAREMPEFSFSSETCIVTIPPRSAPSAQIHSRLRSRRSTTRWSGSARTRPNTDVVPRRGSVAPPAGTATARRATGPETRRGARGATVLRACGRVRERAVAGVMRAPPRR
jgi:hypothetical protein